MNRIDQINAELAARVSIEARKFALELKSFMQEDPLISVLSDDEVILVIADEIKRLETNGEWRRFYLAISICVITLFSILISSIVPMVGVVIAIIWYYFDKQKDVSGFVQAVITALQTQGAQKQERTPPQPPQQKNRTSLPSAFDVPPQE